MVIELREVQFSLKSRVWFSDQNCTPFNSITSIFILNGNVEQSSGNKIRHTIAFFAFLID